MDSLTQIVLGAAVGEVVLGRRIGHRAMVWGAIGGTIPDLDVLANAVIPEIEALAFHRAISHSFFFSIVAPLVFAFLVRAWYRGKWRNLSGYPYVRLGIWLLAYLGLTAGISAIVIYFSQWQGLWATAILLGIGWFIFKKYYALEVTNYREHSHLAQEVGFFSWYWLFFGAFLTHVLLDVCTTYGTQIFQPFSDYRSALSSIAVVDPVYTVPFLGCLSMSAWMKRGDRRRVWWNWLGISVSSLYLLFTIINKNNVERIWRDTLTAHHTSWQRLFTSPTLFNNILWHMVAETDSLYYKGDYALTDHEPVVKLRDTLVKNHDLLSPYAESRPIQILKWFSHGYYAVTALGERRWQVCDLRYGGGVRGEECVMAFIVEVSEHGQVNVHGQRPEVQDIRDAFKKLGQRLKGE